MTRLALLLALLASPAAAVPRVVADIPPVAALVARAMAGVGAPEAVLAGGSPHGHQLRPSEARALAGADLVVWVGPALAPWLAEARESLAPGAASLALLDVEGTELLDAAGGEEHAEEEHDHGPVDTHAWLDPDNAALWLGAIGAALAAADPENAARYRDNAAAGAAEIAAAASRVAEQLAPHREAPFGVYHDAYRYFTRAFGLRDGIALSGTDAATPGPASVATVRDALAEAQARCLFVEPQFDPARARPLSDAGALRLATLDPLGTTLPQGPDLYPSLLEALAGEIAACLGAS